MKKILAAFFAALALSILTAGTVSAEEAEEEESDFRNLFCEFLDSYNPDLFAAYPPCNW